MRILISSRFSNYSTKKAIRFESNGEESWIPRQWILKEIRESEEDLFCEYWIDIPDAKKSARELTLLAFMQFMSREIKFKGQWSKMEGLIHHSRSD